MNIDWDQAPKGATHWDTGGICRIPGWMRLYGGKWFWWPCEEATCERKWFPSTEKSQPIDKFVERPVGWSGAGLPPVGTVCEFYADEDTWRECKIVGENEGYLIVWVSHAHIWTTKAAALLRPVRTPEQISAEEIQAIRDEIGYQRPQLGPCPVEAMYNLGYRKPVKP